MEGRLPGQPVGVVQYTEGKLVYVRTGQETLYYDTEMGNENMTTKVENKVKKQKQYPFLITTYMHGGKSLKHGKKYKHNLSRK